MQKIAYLNPEEIQFIKVINTKKNILSVFNYFWINTSNPNEDYSFVDVIELVFEDHSSLFFKINDDDTGINITQNFEYEKYKTSIQSEFLLQIKLQKVEVTTLPIWKSVLTNSFEEITAIVEKGKFLSTTFWIAFKNQKIELNFHPIEGLVVTEYEEVLELNQK